MFDIRNLSPQERQEVIAKLPIYKKIKKLESMSFELGIYEYSTNSSQRRMNKLSDDMHNTMDDIINELVVLYLIDS